MIEQDLKEALLSLQTAIGSGDGLGIRDCLAKVENLAEENRRTLDPQLKHFLRNRSYVKALSFLEGESDIPKGRCGGRQDFS